MGYFSNYQLEFFSENKEILTEVASALKKRMKSWSVEDLDYIDPIWEGIYWRDNASNEAEDDIVAISASYPDVLFQLTVDGQESDDFWREYVKAGMTQTVTGEIVYPPFDPDQLSSALITDPDLIAVCRVQPGAIIEYSQRQFVVLEQRPPEGTLLIACHALQPMAFGRSNNFHGSYLNSHLHEAYLKGLTDGNTRDIAERSVNLIALNGTAEYGVWRFDVAPLTLEEFRRYTMKDLLPFQNMDEDEWMVTPAGTECIGCNSNGVLVYTKDRGIRVASCDEKLPVRPVICIKGDCKVKVIKEESN